MIRQLSSPLSPRNGMTLLVVIVCRISTEHQDKESLEDQEAVCRRRVHEWYEGPIEFTIIASRGSGEYLDRQELLDLEVLIESHRCDLVLVEDLSRICRRNRAIDICELCVDCATRLIAINDKVDTAEPGWEDAAYASVAHHQRSNRDTSDRLKRTLESRFDRGGVLRPPVYGYVKPEGAKHDSEMRKDPTAEPVIEEMFRRLKSTATYAEIADWLNEQGIAPGPMCRLRHWTAQMVGRFVHNPMLKGMRLRNRVITKRINKTGRPRSFKAEPTKRRYRQCPHLAFVEPEYYDHVILLADERNAQYRRVVEGQPDPRAGVTRKRTRFPGQHARCGICGRRMYWTGLKGHRPAFTCSGAAEYRCWQGLVVSEEDIASNISDAVINAISSLPAFNQTLVDLVQQKLAESQNRRGERRQELERKVRDVEQRLENLLTQIESRPDSDALLGRLDTLEAEKKQHRYELKELDSEPPPCPSLPELNDLRQGAVDALRELSSDDPVAYRLLKQLIPEMWIIPCRPLDGGGLFPRAELVLTLAPIVGNKLVGDTADDTFSRRLAVNLFDEPQYVKFRTQIVERYSRGVSPIQIARELGLTKPVVFRSLRLNRLMLAAGLEDPYQPVVVPPVDCGRLRRHLHQRYRFEPLEGFPRAA